ncbi:MAG TPA: hypothetical protein VLK33_14705 [Terriglobales bacterium]|nr:hypothetical protein [Terriglobales bacterium]
MNAAPFKRCYCTARRGLLAAALLTAFTFICSTSGRSQTTSNRAKSKGPRAVAVLEFDDKKNVHLVPVTIMLNGDFYDASAYKAAPVPMALETETVYEGVRTGVSQGNFTVQRAHQVIGNWVGEGKWQPTDASQPAKKPTSSAPVTEKDGGPPVLRRGNAAPKTETPPATAPTPAPPKEKDKDADVVIAGNPPKQPPKEGTEPADRPRLKRGKPAGTESDASVYDSMGDKPWNTVTTITAVSDVKEETARSYHYSMRADEEANLHEKVQELAAKEVQKRIDANSDSAPARTGKSAKAKAAPAIKFTEVKFGGYDPSTTNEPIFVFEGNTLLLDKLSGKELPNHVMLVVRQDIYAEFHTLFSSISDPTHMDSQPRCEFVDVVDAEGDGYGELLFRRTFDSGRAFSVYRVIGNQLWPLFEGKP